MGRVQGKVCATIGKGQKATSSKDLATKRHLIFGSSGKGLAAVTGRGKKAR